MKTGNMTLRPDSVVQEIIYDDTKNKATGVRVIDAHSKRSNRVFCKSDFCKRGSVEHQPAVAQFQIAPLSQRFG